MEFDIQSICVRRELDASPQALWQAFTDAEALAAWYHPVGFSTPRDSVSTDAVVGGRWSATVVVPADSSEHHFFGRYQKVEQPNLLEYSMYYAAGDAIATAKEEGPTHTVTIVIEAHGVGSRVTYLEYGLLPKGQSVLAQAGMESYFDSLAEYLSREPS